MKRILITAAAVVAFASPAFAGPDPKHCEVSAAAWWAKYVDRGRVDLSKSDPDAGLAYVRWGDGTEHVLTLRQTKARGYCAVKKATPVETRAAIAGVPSVEWRGDDEPVLVHPDGTVQPIRPGESIVWGDGPDFW